MDGWMDYCRIGGWDDDRYEWMTIDYRMDGWITLGMNGWMTIELMDG